MAFQPGEFEYNNREQWLDANQHRADERNQWAQQGEQRLLERQQWQAQNALQKQTNQLLGRQNALSASQVALQSQIRAAQQAGNQIALAQLQVQQQQLQAQILSLEGQKQQLEQEAQHQARRDMQAFAQWRQTPDGREFVKWALDAEITIDRIKAREQRWRQTWMTWALEHMTQDELDTAEKALAAETEIEAAQDELQWSMPNWSKRTWWIASAVALAVSLASFGIVPALALLASPAIVQGYRRKKRVTALQAPITEAAAQRQSRIERLGLDPIDHGENPPYSWTVMDVELALQVYPRAIDEGMRNHIHPSALPKTGYPILVDPESVPIPPLRALLHEFQREQGPRRGGNTPQLIIGK